MAESEQVIRLSGKEDIHAIRTLIARAQAPRLLLVVPNHHEAFRGLVRFKMLARQAYDEGVQLALVTRDGRIRDLAQQVDLSTFNSVEAGRKARRWRAGQGVPAALPSSAERVPLITNSAAWGRGRQAVVERRKSIGTRSNWGENIMLAGLIFGMMIILSAVLLLLVPSARITLVPIQVPLDITFQVTVDPTAREIDFGEGIVPAQVIRQDVQGTFEMATSGRQDVPVELSQGDVLLINVTGQAVTVPTDTVVSTASGNPIRFRTLRAASLPAQINARVEVPIEAVSPGPSGNVGPQQISRIEGAAATAVRVLNQSGTEGGGVQQRAVVTAADRDQLREQLEQRLLQEGRAALERLLEETPEDDYLIPDIITMEITSESFNGGVDDQLDVLTLELRARVSGMVVQRDALVRVSRQRVRDEVPANYRLLDDGYTVVPGETRVVDDGLPIMAVRTQAIAGAQLAADEIRSLVRGQPIDEAHAALLQRLPIAADPAITVTPDWWNRMPYLPLRIFVRVGVLGADQAPQEVVPGQEEP